MIEFIPKIKSDYNKTLDKKNKKTTSGKTIYIDGNKQTFTIKAEENISADYSKEFKKEAAKYKKVDKVKF